MPDLPRSRGERSPTPASSLAGLGEVEIGFGYCEACGHLYQVRPAPAEILDRHYAAFSNYTCFDIEAARTAPPLPLTKRLLALAEAHAPKRGLAYEVGCATGSHLAHLRDAGWKVAGCDPSAKAFAPSNGHSRHRDRLRRRGRRSSRASQP